MALGPGQRGVPGILSGDGPDVVLCVALILCGVWLVRGPQKAGKKQAEAQEDAAGDADFQEYHAMPDAPEMTLSDDTSAKEENGHDE